MQEIFMRHKFKYSVKILWKDLPQNDLMQHWLETEIGTKEIDWAVVSPDSGQTVSTIRVYRHFYLRFKRAEDRIKFILRWI